MSCIVCTARIRGLDPPEDPVTGPLAEGPRGAILAAPDLAGSRRAQLDTSGSDTAATLTSVTGSGDERDAGATISAARPVHPYVHVVIVAVIGAVAVFAWLWFFETVNRLLWENDFVTANRWMFPVICLPFSLLVGLLVKYRHAPTNLDELMLDSLSGDVSKIDWRSLPVTVVMALVSLFSGAVLGPEGGIGGIASKIAALYNEKVQIPAEHRSQLVFSTLASAYNGLIANPLFTGVLGSELVKDADTRARTLPANLIGGSIGYLIFFAAGSSGLENYLHLSPTQPFSPSDVVLVVVFGLIGLILAILAGALFRVASAVFGRFQGREVERALAAGVVFSIVGIVAPIVLFSGETQIQTVVADPTRLWPGAARRHGDRQAGPAGGRVQERLPGRTDVPGDLRVGLRRARAEPAPAGDPDRRPHRRGHGRVPDRLVQGAVHGHPAHRGDAPGRRRADRPHRPGRGRGDDRPALHPGRDRGAPGGARGPASGGTTMKFRATVEQGGKTATGIEVPAEVVAALGSSRKPPVRVTINDYTYRSTVATMGGRFMVGVSAEVRAAAGIAAGDVVDVEMELDTAPREVSVPADFAAALDRDPDARRFFDGLSYSNRLRFVLNVEGAKTDETRQRRIDKSVAMLHEGRT